MAACPVYVLEFASQQFHSVPRFKRLVTEGLDGHGSNGKVVNPTVLQAGMN